jgi:hypothetical protein
MKYFILFLHIICQYIKQLCLYRKGILDNTLIHGDLMINLANRSYSLVATWATKRFLKYQPLIEGNLYLGKRRQSMLF